MATLTDSGEYRIYHRDESSAPGAHLDAVNGDDEVYGGPWFYAPVDWDYPEPFSEGYLTEDSALIAAYDWEEEMLAEGRREIEEEAPARETPDWHQAIGAIPLKEGMPSATETIRQAREEGR